MDNQEKGSIITFPILANGDEYRVVCDDDGKNFILEKMQPVNKKDGSIQYIWKFVGFYGSVLEALQRVLRAFRPNRDVTLEEYAEMLSASQKTLTEAFREISSVKG